MAQDPYYSGIFVFKKMLLACQQQGDKVMIGFEGGRSAFRRASDEYLRTREYKYDWAERPVGQKDLSNWFTGSEMLAMLTQRRLLDD